MSDMGVGSAYWHAEKRANTREAYIRSLEQTLRAVLPLAWRDHKSDEEYAVLEKADRLIGVQDEAL